jgi:archaeosine synthase
MAGLPRKSHNYIRGMLSWQFGVDVDTSGMIIKGRFGNRKVLKKKAQLFSIENETGLYRPTFEGWEHLPGVVRCDPKIRPGDEVFVKGTKAIATGRAAMGASEMTGSQRGVAVKVRKVKKI